jgi:hypothetical protein
MPPASRITLMPRLHVTRHSAEHCPAWTEGNSTRPCNTSERVEWKPFLFTVRLTPLPKLTALGVSKHRQPSSNRVVNSCASLGPANKTCVGAESVDFGYKTTSLSAERSSRVNEAQRYAGVTRFHQKRTFPFSAELYFDRNLFYAGSISISRVHGLFFYKYEKYTIYRPNDSYSRMISTDRLVVGYRIKTDRG